MDTEIQAIRDVWNKEVGSGRDEALTRQLCDQFVASHPEQFTTIRSMSLEECVKAVDVFRSAGMYLEQSLAEIWIWHHFEAQTIGATAEAKVRITNA